MSSVHIATPNHVAWWSDGEDQTTLWSDTAGTVPPALDFDFDPFLDIDWDTGAIFNPSNRGDPAQYPSTSNHMMYPNFASPWPTPMPSPLTEGGSVAPQQSDASWVGFNPEPAQPVAGPSRGCIQTSSFAAPAAPSQAESPWLENTHVDFAGIVSTTPWAPAAFGTPAQMMSPGEYMLPLPRTVLGKRPHDPDTTNSDGLEVANGPRKRAKEDMADNGFLEVAGSTNRARQKPYTRIPVKSNDKFEATGRGAEKFASLNAQEVYHRIIPGPSVQKDSTGTSALPFVEGSEVQQPEVVHGREDAMLEGAERARFRIPTRLDTRQRSLLEATSADWASGTIDEPKCRLCPGAAFSNWVDYKRHCTSMEAHPLQISFCKYCGDFFARGDSLGRHLKNRPPECLSGTPEKAEAKRKETEMIHAEFEEKLEHCLKTGGKIGMPFAQVIKAKYPNSSKRGSRQQNRRLKGPKPTP